MADSVMKEYYKLLRNADKLYDGQVEFVLDHGEKVDEDGGVEEQEENELHIFFFVTPKGGAYKNARIKFHMKVEEDSYPASPPIVHCRNSVYHPNINILSDYENEADICVNLLDSDWEPEVGLDGAVMAVLFLFYNPQLDDALSPVCDCSVEYDEFEENVRRSLRGEEIDGYCFDKLLICDTEPEVKQIESDATTTTTVTATTETPTEETATVADNSDASGDKKETATGAVSAVEDTPTIKENEIIDNNESTTTTPTTSTSTNDDHVKTTEEDESVITEQGVAKDLRLENELQINTSVAENENEGVQNTLTESEIFPLSRNTTMSERLEAVDILQTYTTEVDDVRVPTTTITAAETMITEHALSEITDSPKTLPVAIKTAVKLLISKLKLRLSPFYKKCIMRKS